MTIEEILVRDQMLAMAQAYDTENFLLWQLIGETQIPGIFFVMHDCEVNVEA